jgi:hypothetical protein
LLCEVTFAFTSATTVLSFSVVPKLAAVTAPVVVLVAFSNDQLPLVTIVPTPESTPFHPYV